MFVKDTTANNIPSLVGAFDPNRKSFSSVEGAKFVNGKREWRNFKKGSNWGEYVFTYLKNKIGGFVGIDSKGRVEVQKGIKQNAATDVLPIVSGDNTEMRLGKCVLGLPHMGEEQKKLVLPQLEFEAIWYNPDTGITEGWDMHKVVPLSEVKPKSEIDITAKAGGGQDDAYPIRADSNVIGTVGTAGDSVKIVEEGKPSKFITNTAALGCDVFPPKGGKINGLAVDVAYGLPSGSSIMFHSVGGGQIYTS